MAGPGAGTVYPLRVGAHVIGRGPVGISINDPGVSRRHATVVRSIDGVTIADSGSTNGTFLDGVRISGAATPMRPGARLQIGGSTLVVATPDGPSGRSLTPPRRFNRSPRLDPPDRSTPPVEIVLPAPPHEPPKPQLPVIATVTPLIAGAALAAIMRRPEYLLFTVVSPLMIAGQWLADRSGGGRARRRERVAYEADLVRAQGEIEIALNAEATRRNASAPNPATIDAIAGSAHARLWERRPGDQDFLLVRLGSADLPANLRITGAGPGIEPPIVRDVPLTLTLSDVGVLGIVGPPSRTCGVVRALIGQLAALHSPRDLALMLLAEPSRAHESDWLRWLPHARPASGFDCQLLVGLDPATVSLRLGELLALIDARRAALRTDRETAHRPMVVFIEGRHDQRAIGDLLANGPLVGVYAICIVNHASLLPPQCTAVATVANASSTEISVRTSAAPPIVGTLDAVSAQWIEHLARALAPLRDVAPRRGEALPDTVRWLDLAEVSDDITPDVVVKWRRPGSTRMPLGVGLDCIFELDLARDGPHALIAGTTGSGKSELLQTMVASLAFASRPDELTFVLIDYKGGAAFGACATLPHTVGIVTDLNGALAERALVSLGAELKRRELLLASANASHLDAFRATGGHLARLVIVVDEFASLADELPDFVGGLVGIAQRGRSLGVHLVLATQRPEGVVSADIRANTNLRICLGVTRESESRDVIDTADAARISRTTPGRGFARTGHGELHPFQAGRVGATAVGVAVDGGIHVQRSPFRSLAEPAMPTLGSRGVVGAGTTDLDRIVAACRSAARQLDIETLSSPWLEPLGAVETPNRTSAARPLSAVLGLHDVPLRQAQEPYLIDLDQVSHVMVAGSARSGRTTAVRTLIAELARSTSTEDLHVYALDCAGGALATLSALPHVGAVATMLEHERVVRLISILDAELARRQALLAAHGFGSLAEQRALSADRLPHMVLAIDGWEPFCAVFD
ncbi:MAG TPA: FtsK/SpoIIIE domain-containing protein, partial [Acidothermaceae bacterium]